MERGKNKKRKVIHRKYYLYLPLTIITVFLLGYMGKMTVELITRADFTDNNLLSKIFSENENLTESQAETKTENKEMDDNNTSAEGTENKEPITNEEDSKLESGVGKVMSDKADLKKEAVTIVLEDLLNRGIGNSGTGWTYEHDETGGTLRLSQEHSFTLQNKQDGTEATTSVPIHIIVEEGANNSNIILNNINISRPTRLDSSAGNLTVGEEANAPIFIKAKNVTITLAENTTNHINAKDSSAGIVSQRSAIYLYAGTAGQTYTLNMTGSGKLICEDAGINTYATETTTNNIVIKSGDITVNIKNRSQRTGIGNISPPSSNYQMGNLNIEILGGKITVNLAPSGGIYGAGIGTGYLGGTSSVAKLTIKISGNSNVFVNMDILNNSGDGGIYGAGIGTGHVTSDARVKSLLIEIADNPTVEVKQSITATGTAYISAAAIGSTDCPDSIINLSGGQVKVSQIINTKSVYSLGAASIGQGYSIVDNRMDINISGNVTLDVNGYRGIGSASNNGVGTVNVYIGKGAGGNIPNLLITAQNGQAIVQKNGTTTTRDSIMLSHLDLGKNRTGDNWRGWNDDVEKTLQIVSVNNKSTLREVTIPGNVQSVAYTLPKNISTATGTNVKVSFTNDDKNINCNFINAETGNVTITASNKLKAIAIIFECRLPALRTLYKDGSTGGGTWNYVHDETGGTLYLTDTDDFVLKNLENGSEDKDGSVPIHIIVEKGADNANIEFNNINISRPTRIDDPVNSLAVNDETNAPIFIKSKNITITLVKNTTNYINAKDGKAGIRSERSAIYEYAETVDQMYTLTMTGEGKLICDDAGINTYAASSATSNIVITSGDIEINVVGAVRSGIGSTLGDNNFGNLNIKIVGGNITVNIFSSSRDIEGAGIGTGSGTIGRNVSYNDITITIGGNSSVLVNRNVQGNEQYIRAAGIGIGYANGSGGGKVAYNDITIIINGISNVLVNTNAQGHTYGAGIGTGNNLNCIIEFLLIEIVDNPLVEVYQSISNTSGLSAAMIGLGGSGAPLNSTINLKGGQVKTTQIPNNTSKTFSSASIGQGSNNNGEMNINISGDVKLDVNGYNGLGANTNGTNGTVKVNISKDDDGNVPNLLIIAQKGRAIVERDGTGMTGGVMLSHLDLGANRTGDTWRDWNDDVEKTLQIVKLNDKSVLHEIIIPGNVQSVAYTLPKNISTSTDTNVKVSFASGDGNSISRNFVNAETGNDIITASNNLEAISVIFDLLLPALRTLYEGGSTGGSTWNYTPDGAGGTLRLTDTDDFVLKNLGNGSEDKDGSVPIHIIVEKEASGSNITFSNLNIERASSAKSKTPVLNADSELIAPFMIKGADTVNIILAEGSNNTIDGQDSLLENPGYRTAIYMHAPTESTYTIKIGRENPESAAPVPRLTTLNGGINALGVANTTINMQLKDGNYDLNALNNKYEHAIAFGSGRAEANINTGNYNIVFEAVNENAPATIRALGNDVAIGHNGNLSSSTTWVKGKVNLQAIAFTDGNAISGKFDYSALSFTTTLNKADDWKSIVMHPYSGDELITNNFWELDLPETSLYPTETEQNVSIAYSNPEIDTLRETSSFERMAMRIHNDKGTKFLANTDGTGSTTPVISPNNEVNSGGNMLPTSTGLNINIPKITLETNLLGRTFITPEGEVRNVTNNSALPLALAFAGSTLDNVPAGVGIGNFAKSRKDFADVNGAEVAKLLLELNINQANNGDINFDDEQTQTLIPRSSTPEAEDYVNIATLRGAHNDKISAVDLSVTGMYTEAAAKSINGNFTNTVHLKFSLLDFAEFK